MQAANAFFDWRLKPSAVSPGQARPESRRTSPMARKRWRDSAAGKNSADYKENVSIGPFDLPDDIYYSAPAAYRPSRRNCGPPNRRSCNSRCALTGRRSPFSRGGSQHQCSGVRPASRLLRRDDRPEDQHAASDLRDRPTTARGRRASCAPVCIPTSTCSPSCTPIRHRRPRGSGARRIVGRAVAAGDAFVVNVGDILMRWTNDHWVSTPHRVADPPIGWGERRISIPLFFQANYDTVVKCLRPDETPKYPPVSVGAYRAERFAGRRGSVSVLVLIGPRASCALIRACECA